MLREIPNNEEPAGRTFDDLITAYRLSPAFRAKALTTQRDYDRYLKIIREAWGPLLVSGVRPKHVLKLRDAWAEAPVAANMLGAIAKLLINWGCRASSLKTIPVSPFRSLKWRTAEPIPGQPGPST